MRKMIFTVFLAAAFLPLTSIAAPNTPIQSERELRNECSLAFLHQEEVQNCLAKKAAQSQKTLKLAEEKAQKALSEWDEDDKYTDLAKEKLAASELAFIKYREEQCAFASSLGGGAAGGALEMRRLACVAELNNRRAEQLRNSVPLK